jgi:hypothetical protein
VDIAQLIEALGRTEAYPGSPEDVEIRQTHISVVALAGAHAYKVKKPVDLGFLDFTTLEKRRHFCEEEVRLNRRLAPGVYEGVVPITRCDGGLAVEGKGTPVEYAVKMERLPERATLGDYLRRGELTAELLEELARRVAAFHADAASGGSIDRFGGWEVVGANARENLEQSRRHVGECLSASVFERLGALLEERLTALRPLMESRVRAHVPRDTHGDLHLEHVYLFPDRSPPRDLVVIDCIEFNDRFRYADPVADMAFLVMDLRFHGRRDLADSFADAYFRAADDPRGRELLPFYVAYRAAVRAKVEGMAAEEEEVPEDERRAAVRRARAHWLLALSELESPSRRPCLLLVGGLPGTGKTTLAGQLVRSAGFESISSDRMRKTLAGIDPETPAAAAFGEGIYTPEWNDRTYDACLERAGELLFEGRRVLVEASFREAHRRRAFLRAGLEWGVRTLFVLCTADPDTVRRRMGTRRGGPSDADWAVYEAAAAAWEVDGTPDPRWSYLTVSTDGDPGEAADTVSRHLAALGLVSRH